MFAVSTWYTVFRIITTGSYLDFINLLHTNIPYLFKIHFNIIPKFKFRYPKPPSGFYAETIFTLSAVPHSQLKDLHLKIISIVVATYNVQANKEIGC